MGIIKINLKDFIKLLPDNPNSWLFNRKTNKLTKCVMYPEEADAISQLYEVVTDEEAQIIKNNLNN